MAQRKQGLPMSEKQFAFWFFLLLTMFLSTRQVSLASPDNLDHIYTMPANGQDSSLIYQMIEQNFADPNVVLNPALIGGTNGIERGNETYQGIKQFWHNDLLGGFFAGISQAISNGLNQSFNGYLPGTIAALSSVVKSFFLTLT